MDILEDLRLRELIHRSRDRLPSLLSQVVDKRRRQFLVFDDVLDHLPATDTTDKEHLADLIETMIH